MVTSESPAAGGRRLAGPLQWPNPNSLLIIGFPSAAQIEVYLARTARMQCAIHRECSAETGPIPCPQIMAHLPGGQDRWPGNGSLVGGQVIRLPECRRILPAG